MLGVADTKGSGRRFEARVGQMKRLGNDSEGTGEEMFKKIIGDGINFYILFGHREGVYSDTNLAMTVAFIVEKVGYCRGVGSVDAQTIAGFGREDDQFPTGEGGGSEREYLGIGDRNYLHEGILAG